MWYSQRISTLYHMKRGQLSPSWGGYHPRMPCYLLCSQVESILSSTQNPIIRKRHVWSTLAERNSPGFSAGHFQSIDNWLEATRRDDSTRAADRRIPPQRPTWAHTRTLAMKKVRLSNFWQILHRQMTFKWLRAQHWATASQNEDDHKYVPEIGSV